MMRHKYGFNCQVVNWGGFNELMPLGYIEVVPGETVTGSVSFAARSQPLKLAVDTRAYLDVYGFYIPFRLLYSGWPDFISSGGVTGGPLPTVTDLFTYNFEDRLALSDGTNWVANVAWQRYAYNMVWNKFFRREDQAERALSLAGVAYASQRPSTLETKALLGSQQNQDTTVTASVSGATATLSLNALREGFSKDNFNKMRAWYGNRYIDYLAALGVQVSWSILQEPEIICQKHHDWRFIRATQLAPSTSPSVPDQTSVGQTAGHFFTNGKLSVKRTFVPEHGLLCFYGVTRADAIYGVPPQPPIIGKGAAESYWSPERNVMAQNRYAVAGQAPEGLSPQVFGSYANVAAATGSPWVFPMYEEYRTGINYNGINGVTTGPLYGLIASTASMASDRYISRVAADYNANYAISTSQGYQNTIQYRLIRHSPVAKIDTRLKLS